MKAKTAKRRKKPSPLKMARITRGFTQAEVARRLRVDQSFISALESGRREPSRGTMLDLSRLYCAGIVELWPDMGRKGA